MFSFGLSKVWDMASKHVLFQMDPVKVGKMFRVERLEMVFNTHMNFEYDVIPNILAFWSLKQTYCEWPIQEPMGSHTNW